MSRILYRLVGNNPIQPNNFWIKTIGKMWYNIFIRCKTLRHLGIKQRVLSIRSVCVPGIVPGCRQVKMTFCRQDYPATSCTPTKKMNWYQLTRLLWSNRDFSPNTPKYTCSHIRGQFYIIPPRQFRLREGKHPIHTRGVSMKTEYQRPQLADSLS